MHYAWGHRTTDNLKPRLAYFPSLIFLYQSEIVFFFYLISSSSPFGHNVGLSEADEKGKSQKVRDGFLASYHWQRKKKKSMFNKRTYDFQPKKGL